MWLVVLVFAAAISTAIWYAFEGKYKLGTLSLILWGAAIMVFVDHLMGYLEGDAFIEMTANATLLGIFLVIAALVIWIILLFNSKERNKVI